MKHNCEQMKGVLPWKRPRALILKQIYHDTSAAQAGCVAALNC